VKIHADYSRVKYDHNDEGKITVTYHTWLVKEFRYTTDRANEELTN
jgi:hypothetical protein